MDIARRVFRCRRGTVAIESALIFPILVLFLLGMVEVSTYLEASRKAMAATQTVADLVAQETGQTTASLMTTRNAAKWVMEPFADDDRTLGLTIASVGFDNKGDDPRVLWKFDTGTGGPTINPATAKGLSDPLESVVVVRLQFTYHSPFNFLFSDIDLDEMAFARPRLDRRTTLNGKTEDP